MSVSRFSIRRQYDASLQATIRPPGRHEPYPQVGAIRYLPYGLGLRKFSDLSRKTFLRQKRPADARLSVEVRKCSPRDLQAITELAEGYTSFDMTPTLADIEGMHTRNPEYFFVAEADDGRVIGFITGYERKGIPEEVLKTWDAKRVGYVDLMAVNPSHRRIGVGRALINAILEEFRRNHVDVVNLDVPAEQDAAVGLYRSLGFSVRAYNMRKRLT